MGFKVVCAGVRLWGRGKDALSRSRDGNPQSPHGGHQAIGFPYTTGPPVNFTWASLL
jgi:hypothetical protein